MTASMPSHQELKHGLTPSAELPEPTARRGVGVARPSRDAAQPLLEKPASRRCAGGREERFVCRTRARL